MPFKKLELLYIKEKTNEIAPGFFCLSTEYKNSKTLMKFKCDNGHIFYKTWNMFSSYHICPYCSKRYRRTITDIKRFCELYKYKLLSKKYENVYSKIKVECPNGHIYETRADTLLGKHWCRQCYYESISINNSGENHYNWQGGKTFEPYCVSWTKEYKDYIKERDRYLCLNPQCYKTSNNLVVHHINYDKKNCRRRNLITLCNSCNVVANYDREWHELWYKTIIERKYKRNGEFIWD